MPQQRQPQRKRGQQPDESRPEPDTQSPAKTRSRPSTRSSPSATNPTTKPTSKRHVSFSTPQEPGTLPTPPTTKRAPKTRGPNSRDSEARDAGAESAVPELAIAKGETADDAVCAALNEVRAQVLELAAAFLAPVVAKHGQQRAGAGLLEALLAADAGETARYVGLLAMGGPEGQSGWEVLLGDADGRRAVVAGVVGRALKEHVFGPLWFGASEAQERELDDLQRAGFQAWGEGFARTRQRGAKCVEFARSPTSRAEDAQRLAEAEAQLTRQLTKLLMPLWEVKKKNIAASRTAAAEAIGPRLRAIVAATATLSRQMRLMPEVVFYWEPVHKDEVFEPARMESMNLRAMLESTPWVTKKVAAGAAAATGPAATVLRDGQEKRSQSLVQVVVFPGLVAWRQGGGERAKEEIRRAIKEEAALPPDVRLAWRKGGDAARNLTGNDGYRTRVLAKGVVFLHWSRQRLLTLEAGTSAHHDAVSNGETGKYREDYEGFVELWPLWLQRNEK